MRYICGTQEKFTVGGEERNVGEKGNTGLAHGVVCDLGVRVCVPADPAR